ncbi:MAG: hypothetical protein ACREM2_05825 [Vulcanimicrobiaceae bacterium]
MMPLGGPLELADGEHLRVTLAPYETAFVPADCKTVTLRAPQDRATALVVAPATDAATVAARADRRRRDARCNLGVPRRVLALIALLRHD